MDYTSTTASPEYSSATTTGIPPGSTPHQPFMRQFAPSSWDYVAESRFNLIAAARKPISKLPKSFRAGFLEAFGLPQGKVLGYGSQTVWSQLQGARQAARHAFLTSPPAAYAQQRVIKRTLGVEARLAASTVKRFVTETAKDIWGGPGGIKAMHASAIAKAVEKAGVAEASELPFFTRAWTHGVTAGKHLFGPALAAVFVLPEIRRGVEEGGLFGGIKAGIHEGIMFGLYNMAWQALGPFAIPLLVGTVTAGAAGVLALYETGRAHRIYKRYYGMEWASPINDQYGNIATMRQRSLMAMQRSGLNARYALGREASLLHV